MKFRLYSALPVSLLLFMTAALSPSCAQSEQSDVEKVFYVDVRTPEEFAQGSAPGAVNIPLNEIESRLDEFKNKDEIVVMCRSGNRSRQAKTLLEQHGIANVTDGGPWQHVAQQVKGN